MSSAPPPLYPPPYPPRQSQRAAYRAQREAERAQRYYWRALRRPSLVRPVVLIAVGIVALLLEAGKLPAPLFWEWYIHWWPLLLIGVGVLLLAEWWFNRDRPYGVRSGGGGLIFLLVILAAFGWAGHGLRQHGPFNWNFMNPNDNDWGMHFFGQEHDEDHQIDEALPPDSNIRIENPRGDVTITASSDARIHVSAHNTVFSSNDREASNQLRSLVPNFSLDGRVASLSTARVDHGGSDLTIQLPVGSAAEINAGRGDVTVDGLSGAVTVNSGHGDVKFTNIKNSVVAHMASGDFTAHSVTGAVTLDGRLEDAHLSDIQGRVTLNGDFFGDLTLANIAAPVSFHSSRTEFAVERVPGELSLDSGDLRVNQGNAPVRVTAHAKDIELSAITGGPVQVENADGDIALGMAAQPGDIQMHNGNGDIDVTLPDTASCVVEATAPMGDISSDWSLEDGGTKSDHNFSGRIGTGAHPATLKLVSDHGNISIKRGGAAIAVPPVPPTPPTPPRNARHLKAPAGPTPQPTEQ